MDQVERCLVGAPEMREAAWPGKVAYAGFTGLRTDGQMFLLVAGLATRVSATYTKFAPRKHILGPTGRGANTQQCVYAWP